MTNLKKKTKASKTTKKTTTKSKSRPLVSTKKQEIIEKRAKTSKKKIVIEETPDQKAEKARKHVEKIVKKQEARLPEHIKRVKNKESKGPAANKERFYVTNAKLLNELYIWRDSAPESKKKDRIITEEFGKMIKMIAERLTNHSNFKNYPYDIKQDMISYACFKCIQGIHNYNFEFKNAFAYFTTACYNAFVSTISKYYKNKNLYKDLVRRSLEKLESTKDINANKILSQFMKEYLGEDVDLSEKE